MGRISPCPICDRNRGSVGTIVGYPLDMSYRHPCVPHGMEFLGLSARLSS
jgi:hypothetical protein